MRLLLSVCLSAMLAGCGSPGPMKSATTPELSLALLTLALDAWKGGASQVELSQRNPPVYFVDDAYRRGAKLTSYTIEDTGKPVGTGISYVVTLQLQEAGAAPAAKKVAFRVVTSPNNSIAREDGMP